MAHHRVSGAAVPVLLPGRGPDGLPRAQPDRRAVARDDQADAVGADEQLAVGMGVPLGAGARVKRTNPTVSATSASLKTGLR
jgi:hypothetical protein